MKTTLLLFVALLGLPCLGQDRVLRVEPANMEKDVVVEKLDPDYQDVTTVTVTNVSDRTLRLRRFPNVIGKPTEWDYAVFNQVGRTGPYLMQTAREQLNRSFSLAPGATASFQLVLEPDGATGDGRVEVRFTDANSPEVVLGKATVTTEIIRRGNAGGAGGLNRRPAPTALRLYPNPARERFFVDIPNGVDLGRVEVSNALGKRLRKFDGADSKDGFDINNLPDGLYLISLYDSQGKKLKTLRLLHRQFGA